MKSRRDRQQYNIVNRLHGLDRSFFSSRLEIVPFNYSIDINAIDENDFVESIPVSALMVDLKVEYLIICIICDTDLVNKLILQVYTLHKYK